MEGRLMLIVGIAAVYFANFVTAEPDSGWKQPTHYTSSHATLTTKSDSYWTTGNEVAVYLVIIPLLLIPLILIALKIFERGGEYGHANGHFESDNQKYKRAFKAVSDVFLNHLTKRVYDAIKE